MLSINRLSIELKFRNCKRSSADMSNFCCDDLNESLSEASCMPHCAQASPRSSPYRLGASLPVSNSRKPDSCPPNGSRNPSVSDCFCGNRRNSTSPLRTSARSATKFREIIVRHADPFQMVRLTGVTQKPVQSLVRTTRSTITGQTTGLSPLHPLRIDKIITTEHEPLSGIDS